MTTTEVEITQDELDLIRRNYAPGATEDELRMYLYDCKRRGVHPMDRLIHFTKRRGRYTPITSIDFMRMRANATGEFAGKDPVKYEGEPGKPGFSATVTVYKMVQGQRCGWTATAWWEEYYPGKEHGFMWDKMPRLMLAKCAEALALRQAFPAQLQGLYIKEEMDQAGPEPGESGEALPHDEPSPSAEAPPQASPSAEETIPEKRQDALPEGRVVVALPPFKGRSGRYGPCTIRVMTREGVLELKCWKSNLPPPYQADPRALVGKMIQYTFEAKPAIKGGIEYWIKTLAVEPDEEPEEERGKQGLVASDQEWAHHLTQTEINTE